MTNPSGSAHLLLNTSERGRGFRFATRALVTTATAAAFIGLASVSASAAPNDTATDTATANVVVTSVITLALDDDDFTLTGNPGDTPFEDDAVTGFVTTNSSAGYNVSVLAAADALAPTLPGNGDDIPITALQVHNNAGVYTSLSTTVPVVTTIKTSKSDPLLTDGDPISDDYQVTIPNVNSDTYTVELNYTATALA